jgi:long-chain acyl-CoA synthetase
MEQRFGTPIYAEYSSSEAGIIARVTPSLAGRKPGSVGVPFLDVRIVDDAGTDVPSGGEGEIVVRGSTVMPADALAPRDRARAFTPDGWLCTGDLGRLDRDGYLFVTGRTTEIINRGGGKIVPAEVDDALLTHPAVAAAAVFAAPDPRLGEDIVAAVRLKPGCRATPRELRTWLLGRLSPYKVPRRFWFVDDLPHTATGKVQRGELTRRWRG